MILRVEDGETISDRESRNVVLLADGPELTVTWSRYAPGEIGPSLHIHREHTDAFYILDGEMTFGVGPDADTVTAGPGVFVAVPPGIAHRFANESDAQARWLNFHAPDAGFAAFMRAVRDGVQQGFDSFDAPPDGGLPADGAIITRPDDAEPLASGGVVRCVLPELCVIEWPGEPTPAGLGVCHSFELTDGRRLTIEAPPGEVSAD